MTKIGPNETLITGRWLMSDGSMVGDQGCERIEALTYGHLVKIGQDNSGWDTLYQDPTDDRFWELIYPQSEMHGGGPPQLRRVAASEVATKYGHR